MEAPVSTPAAVEPAPAAPAVVAEPVAAVATTEVAEAADASDDADKPARANRASNISSSSEAVVKSSEGSAAPEGDNEPTKPKKAGWWQRRGFF